jgi:hypothetical protein
MLLSSYGNYFAASLAFIAYVIFPALPFSLMLKRISKSLKAFEAYHIAITFMLFLSTFVTLVFDRRTSFLLLLLSLFLDISLIFYKDEVIKNIQQQLQEYLVLNQRWKERHSPYL